MIWETSVSAAGKQKLDFLKEISEKIIETFDYLSLSDVEYFTDDIMYNELFASENRVMVPSTMEVSNYFELAFWDKRSDNIVRVHLDTRRITCEIHQDSEERISTTSVHNLAKELFKKYFIGSISGPNFGV